MVVSRALGVGRYTAPPLVTLPALRRQRPGAAGLMRRLSRISVSSPDGAVSVMLGTTPFGSPETGTSTTVGTGAKATVMVVVFPVVTTTFCVVVTGA